jgi:hypothetical protein
MSEITAKSKTDVSSIKERLNQKFKNKTAAAAAATSDNTTTTVEDIPDAEIITDATTTTASTTTAAGGGEGEKTVLDASLARVESMAQLIAEQVYDNALIAAGLADDPRSMLTRLNKILTAVLPAVPPSPATTAAEAGNK